MSRLLVALFAVFLIFGSTNLAMAAKKPIVTFKTSLGDFSVELEPQKAPETVENFLAYVRNGHYDGTIFHRIIIKFMVQGGGFTSDFEQKPTRDPIQNEAHMALPNERGTIAMARTGDPHSATSQFFINLVYNKFLDFVAMNQQGWGYTAFGRVIDGMNIIGRMSRVTTGNSGQHQDVPKDPIIIMKAIITSE